ncbi:MAG: flagellar hook-basal body protein, partial [Phycisphaerae bacterium]
LVANNLANAHTTGFKHDLAVIRQREIERRGAAGGMAYRHPVLDGMTGGLFARPTYHSVEQGRIERTGRPLDVAIEGDGFLAVQDGDEVRYTRDGELALNRNHELVLSAGGGRWRVLSDRGAPIVLARGGGEVGISDDGTVRQGGTVVATLSLMTTEDKQSLRKGGENVFDASGAEMVPADGRFVVGAREQSTYDMMRGLAAMIEATRAYQLNATLIQLQDQMTGQAVSRVGQVS